MNKKEVSYVMFYAHESNSSPLENVLNFIHVLFTLNVTIGSNYVPICDEGKYLNLLPLQLPFLCSRAFFFVVVLLPLYT